jgi:capsular polysaccharide transport system permease protein
MSERGLRVVPAAEPAVPDASKVEDNATPVVARRGMAVLSELQGPRLGALGRGLRRRSAMASFVLLVLLPTLVTGIYMYGFASDQYVAEMRFGVRAPDARGNDATSVFQGAAVASQIGLDSYVLVQFMRSREFVDQLQDRVPLRTMFQAQAIDPLARLPKGVTAERLVEYWGDMIDPFFDMTNGTITVRVRAFSAAEALQLATETEAICDKLIAGMTAHLRAETMTMAEAQAAKAEERLKAVLQQRAELRRREGAVDPGKIAEGTLKAAAQLRDQLGRAKAELTSMQRYKLAENSPQIVNQRNKIAGLEQEVAAIEQQSSDISMRSSTLGQSTTSFEQLASEQEVAEKVLATSLESLERARMSAGRQGTYLVPFVHASLPEEALYPRRARTIAVAFVAGFALWATLWLAAAAIREHL